ncbi:hypothetical protein RI065_09285 [Mycoplasmatota bacterium zrk1]
MEHWKKFLETGKIEDYLKYRLGLDKYGGLNGKQLRRDTDQEH